MKLKAKNPLQAVRKALVVVAHPDDEAIFFAGLVLSYPNIQWQVVCVTDGNADGRGLQRAREFKKSARALGFKKVWQWDFPDRFEKRLNLKRLAAHLKQLDEDPDVVFTHSAIGEYGHPHHQDVAYGVHLFYLNKNVPVFSPAYQCTAEFLIHLTPKLFQKKARILFGIYRKELERFGDLLPVTGLEGFQRTEWAEVYVWYRYWTAKESLKQNKINRFRDFISFSDVYLKKIRQRSF